MNNKIMEDLKSEILQCTKCGLSLSRSNVIFGEGNYNAKVLLIGEAPGRDEDIQGRPFVGKSGQLLDKILEACGFNRQKHLFISNIVKCRPPENRIPTEEEAKVCMPFLFKQIELIDPIILVLLGSSALKYLMGPEMRISRIRGTWLNWKDKYVMPVYHPAALLRNTALKRDTWEDYKKIIYKYRELVDPKHYSLHA
jgi:uracil-DNA glycosylase